MSLGGCRKQGAWKQRWCCVVDCSKVRCRQPGRHQWAMTAYDMHEQRNNLRLEVAGTDATTAIVVSEAVCSNGCIRHTTECMSSRLCMSVANTAEPIQHMPTDASVVQSTSCCTTISTFMKRSAVSITLICKHHLWVAIFLFLYRIWNSTIWNSLPQSLCLTDNYLQFCQHLKTCLFNIGFN